MLLYLGPETTMPLVSFLGAIIGVGLIVGNQVVAKAKTIFRIIARRPAPVKPVLSTSAEAPESHDPT